MSNLLLKESGDTLHFFVNHWPSRYGGVRKEGNKKGKGGINIEENGQQVSNSEQKCRDHYCR